MQKYKNQKILDENFSFNFVLLLKPHFLMHFLQHKTSLRHQPHQKPGKQLNGKTQKKDKRDGFLGDEEEEREDGYDSVDNANDPKKLVS